MSHFVAFERSGRIGVIVIDNPPVNAISPGVTRGLVDALVQFEAASDLDALVLCCAGRTWVAGGDIAAFEDPLFSAAPLNAFLAQLEAQSRPVVASLHGTVLGGGLELAMACHARVAHASTRLGMPEVRLGLLPGSLGTQRLPRLVGPGLGLHWGHQAAPGLRLRRTLGAGGALAGDDFCSKNVGQLKCHRLHRALLARVRSAHLYPQQLYQPALSGSWAAVAVSGQ